MKNKTSVNKWILNNFSSADDLGMFCEFAEFWQNELEEQKPMMEWAKERYAHVKSDKYIRLYNAVAGLPEFKVSDSYKSEETGQTITGYSMYSPLRYLKMYYGMDEVARKKLFKNAMVW